jgi:hypothetical protein
MESNTFEEALNTLKKMAKANAFIPGYLIPAMMAILITFLFALVPNVIIFICLIISWMGVGFGVRGILDYYDNWE